MGKPIRIEELARRMIRAAGYTVRDGANPHGDIELQYTGARAGEKLSEELSLGDTIAPTSHPRIFTAMEPPISEFELAHLLRDVRLAVEQGRPLRLPPCAGPIAEQLSAKG